MTVSIKPTVGRIVWFWPYGERSERPSAAIVTYVHDNERVNLVVFSALGLVEPTHNVFLLQPDDPKVPHESYCEWMPYQTGQATKTESLQRTLAALCVKPVKNPDSFPANPFTPKDTK